MVIQLLALATVLAGFGIFLKAIANSKAGSFYSDTHWLLLTGVFVWGDGLILGPFWIVSGFIFLFLTLQQIAIFCALFYAVRSGFEVVYWLTHQAAGHTYQPPLFRNISWLDAKQSAILYQLLTMSWMCMSLFVLILLTMMG